MPSNRDDAPWTDDYVANILKRDAERKNQSRALASGLGSLLSRPRGNAPKPNTRFLRNIVRDADTHNTALRKKEEEDSRSRLKELKRRGDSRKRRDRSRSPGKRHRTDGNDQSRHSRRKRTERDKSRSRDRYKHRSRSRSPRRSPESFKEGHRSLGQSDDRGSRQQRRQDRFKEQHDSESDSDPLESIIGPKPPPKVQARGRGAYKDSSMDARFDPNYDPKADVALDADEEGDDWDMALEALRDRAKWRKSGADRLRAAGFTDTEVSQWEKGSRVAKAGGGDVEKDISDVRWSKKGESREWDRGKVVDGERVDIKPEWGRLKDS